jgi:GNAT superfamily N-acetyltransferase
MARYETRPFTRDSVAAASELLAARHRRQRLAWPALDPAYEEPEAVAPLIEEQLGRAEASGVVVYAGGEPIAFVLGAPRPGSIWGANVWVEDCGSAGTDREAIRTGYAAAAAEWAAAGRTRHYVVVPASDVAAVEAWFSLSFGLQHIHAVREPVAADYGPAAYPDLTVRQAEERDVPALVTLDDVLPIHQGNSPVFSPMPVPTEAESIASVVEELHDPRFTTFVAEHDGRIVGSATACLVELSHATTPLMQPLNCGFLAYAAVASDARGLGAGRALADAVLLWSRDEGHQWVAADWRSTNLEADRAWRAAGFKPTFYRLFRSIA